MTGSSRGGGGGAGKPGRGIKGASQPAAGMLRLTFDDNTTSDVPLPASTVPGPAPVIVPFANGTAVVAGNLTNYNGALYPVITAHTFGATFDATKHGSGVALPGVAGPVGLNNRGPWQPNTQYAVSDAVSAQGGYYRCPVAFTSGSAFNPANWVTVTPPPFLYPTALTGGSPSSLVYLAADGVTCYDLHVSFLDQLGFSILLYKDHLGQYWLPGALITANPATPLTPGYVRAMQPQTSMTAANWRDLDPRAAQPADLAPTANQAYVEFGRIVSATQWRFRDPQVDGLASTATTRADGLTAADYPRNAVAPTSKFRADRFGTFENSSPTYVYNANGNTTRNPNSGAVLFQPSGGGKNRFGTDEVEGTFPDGQIRYTLTTSGATNRYGLHLRTTGAAGTETSILVTGDEQSSSNNLRISVLVNGVETVLSTGSLALNHSANYQWRAEAVGTFVGLKVWPLDTAEPAEWMLRAFQSTVTGAGYSGPYSYYPTVDVGNYSVVVGKGAPAPIIPKAS